MTPSSTRYLRHLLAFRTRPPTILAIVRASLRRYVFLVVAFGMLTGFAAWGLGNTFAIVVMTAFASTLLRDLDLARHSVALWPVTREIIDWPHVERLLAPGAPPETPTVS